MKKRKSLFFVHFNVYCFHFHKRKSMFAVLHLDNNSHKSSLLHLTGQPYWKKSRSAKVKDGIITYFLGTIWLINTKQLVYYLLVWTKVFFLSLTINHFSFKILEWMRIFFVPKNDRKAIELHSTQSDTHKGNCSSFLFFNNKTNSN